MEGLSLESLYQNVMLSAKQSVYLLSQWTQSLDNAAGIQTDVSADPVEGHVDDPTVADEGEILPKAKAGLEIFEEQKQQLVSIRS